MNVALRAPYGHDGAYQDLADVVRHHLDVQTATTQYAQSPDKGRLSPFLVTTLRSSAPLLAVLDPLVATPKALTPAELADLLAFLSAQSAYDASPLATDIPTSVPSGMPVDR